MKNSATSPAGHLARGIDLLVGLTVVIVLSPVMPVRAMAALVSSGRVFDYTSLQGLDARGFLALDFAGPSAGASLARWFNVLSGDLALGGPAPADPDVVARLLREVPERFSVRPGLVTVGGVRRQLGMAGTSEDEGDREFARRHGTTSVP